KHEVREITRRHLQDITSIGRNQLGTIVCRRVSWADTPGLCERNAYFNAWPLHMLTVLPRKLFSSDFLLMTVFFG
ncbi:MAG: hypothetical protein ACE5I8_02590, partial [Thermodesulfobacteriota bacterium]